MSVEWGNFLGEAAKEWLPGGSQEGSGNWDGRYSVIPNRWNRGRQVPLLNIIENIVILVSFDQSDEETYYGVKPDQQKDYDKDKDNDNDTHINREHPQRAILKT